MTNPSSCKMASPRALSPCSVSERAYRATCTLPPMPKKCPDCKAKVELCHINFETNEGVFVCPDTKCGWPFDCEGKKYEEFSGFSDIKLYQKWQEELKKKKRRNKDSRRSSSVTSGEDVDPHSDKDDPSLKSGLNVDKSHVTSIFDVQKEAESEPSKKKSRKHQDARIDAEKIPSDEKVAVPDISSEAKSSPSPIADAERDTFLLPEKPVSAMTPRRKDNSFIASDNEDYGDISDAEPDLNIFRYE